MPFELKGSAIDLRLNKNQSAIEISADILVLGNKLVRTCVELGGATQAWFAKVDEKQIAHWVTGWPNNTSPVQFSSQTLHDVIYLGKEFTYHNHTELVSGGLFPILKDGQVVGLLALLSDQTDYFCSSTLAWIRALTETLSYSVIQVENQMKKVQAEYSVNRILQSGMSLRETFRAIFELLSDLADVEAAIVLKYKPASQQFDLLVTHGIDAKSLAKIHLYIENGLTRRTVGGGRSIQAGNWMASELGESHFNLFAQEGFQAHITIPLIGRYDLLGVIEIFWRASHDIDTWKLEILQMVGEAVTFFLEHTTIIEALKRRNDELSSTYTATIEGLSRALELRDLETDGHTRRVSALTLRLTEHMQIPADQRASIQQGALLHDIGKLGIPDAILLKPGSLTPREWKVMQQHPLYAYNILAPIVSLREALDIPLYHHERWNGTGYPYGLAGEQIPLSARLFAVVDVYDALTSDRPYRSAWSRSQALEYLQEQAGQQFDPHVVAHFLEMINET